MYRSKGGTTMTSTTLEKIKEYGHGVYKQDALEALLDYYGKTSFMNISEEQALGFLQKLESGEITI